ncbi:IdgA domain protein, partial [Aureobasidium melanogenum]
MIRDRQRYSREETHIDTTNTRRLFREVEAATEYVRRRCRVVQARVISRQDLRMKVLTIKEAERAGCCGRLGTLEDSRRLRTSRTRCVGLLCCSCGSQKSLSVSLELENVHVGHGEHQIFTGIIDCHILSRATALTSLDTSAFEAFGSECTYWVADKVSCAGNIVSYTSERLTDFGRIGSSAPATKTDGGLEVLGSSTVEEAAFETPDWICFISSAATESLILASMKGVLAAPVAPACAASCRASSITLSISALAILKASGMGFANNRPDCRPRDLCAWMTAAAVFSLSKIIGLWMPLSLVQKAGKSILPSRPSANVATGTPWVSRYSRVLPMSRKLLQPLLTTATGVRPSSVRSAEMSMVLSAPLWTPPKPPDTNGSRNTTAGPDNTFQVRSQGDIVWIRETMSIDCAFKCDNGSVLMNSLLNFVGDSQI